jgi:2-(1,2-epoxy-1,2-dihydrophenyl)acetyl-CoA isomerase
MPDAKLLADRSDGILTLTLNRPGKLNAIDNEMAEALLQALEAAATDASVGAIRIRGSGRAFCAGRDVSAAPTDKDLELVQAVACAIAENPKPVLVAVHGWTVGAGLEWALDADIVIASSDARFKLPEASLGVFVTGGLVATLPAAVGLARAKALLLLGEELDAHGALDWGLICKVVEPADLETASHAACQRLAALDPKVAMQFKRVLNSFGQGEFRRALAEESSVQRALQQGA